MRLVTFTAGESMPRLGALVGPADAVADLQALVDAKLAERPDGFSVGRLQEVADAVTKYYRDRGLILAQDFVPVQ